VRYTVRETRTKLTAARRRTAVTSSASRARLTTWPLHASSALMARRLALTLLTYVGDPFVSVSLKPAVSCNQRVSSA
jgi:hypothetical protein